MRKHYVYRGFDGADRLLYVGSTNDVTTRIKTHKASSAWAVYMARHTVEEFDSKEDADQAEARAIAEEHPRWNITGRSAGHPEGFATSQQQAAWLRPEREVAQNVKRLRADVNRTRAKLRRLLLDLRIEESIVDAISNGMFGDSYTADDAELLGVDDA